MTEPKRIQRKRIKGWRKPKGAVYVGRGSSFGNPFKIGDLGIPDAAAAVEAFKIHTKLHGFPSAIEGLRGKYLMCWCPLDQPCHADVLLELANEVTE